MNKNPYTVKVKFRCPKEKSPFTYGLEVSKWCVQHDLQRFRDYDWGVSDNFDKRKIWFIFLPKHQQIANMLIWRWAA